MQNKVKEIIKTIVIIVILVLAAESGYFWLAFFALVGYATYMNKDACKEQIFLWRDMIKEEWNKNKPGP